MLHTLINDMHCLPCFAMLLPLVVAAKIHFKEQTLATGTKQSSKANKVRMLTRQTGQKGSQACQFCYAPACLFCACY
jgi:hypothetical protein